MIFLGQPGTGKTHLSIALGDQAARRGCRVAFATATHRAHQTLRSKEQGRLSHELDRLARIPLIVIDEVRFIPFDPEAASLFLSPISSRYERKSLIVTSNKNFFALAEIFRDAVAVAAMVDRVAPRRGHRPQRPELPTQRQTKGDHPLTNPHETVQFSTGQDAATFNRP